MNDIIIRLVLWLCVTFVGVLVGLAVEAGRINDLIRSLWREPMNDDEDETELGGEGGTA